MPNIPETVIATSDPLSLCNGNALFPALGTFRSGYVGTGMAGTIFSINDENILLFRFSANAKYEVVFGLCGPAYAAKLVLEGSTDNKALELTIVEDELQAGILFGLTLSFVCNISLDTLKLNWVWQGWNSHFASSWLQLADFHINLEFDVIELLWELIKEGFESEGKETIIKKVPLLSNQLVGSWGMYDERANNFASNGGEMVANPTLNLPIDIAPMIGPVAELNLALKALFSRLSFGPLIGIQMPVTVKMKTVTLDSAKYSNLTFVDGKMGGTTAGTDPSNPTKLTLELDHTAGFDLAFGIFLNLNLVKLFNIGFSTTWPLLKTLGIQPNFGPYTNNLSNTIGKTTGKACSQCGDGSTGLFDVIFEAPGGLGYE
ncbi:MAG: hypothetical protein PHP95_02640 [Desulfuromonadaceae bacterium]|nr:hypothetical protein [Desulfuromonadaceae bacterium]MDD2847333.1 hypothetical protein [Desulfuromonadaceae bacterium]MDD4130277.1 hypothetical protein [Desulfuromonadaceae bacterium]